MRAVVKAFEGQSVHRAPRLGYRITLLLTALGLCLLIVAYFACLAGLGWGLYLYATRVVPASFHLRGGRILIIIGLMHLGVGLAGLALLYSLLAPLFRRGRSEPDGDVLAATQHPVLHCFVRALCTLIKAPPPDEIRTFALVNASAARYGGFLGILGGKLVLTIGEPLFYGLTLRSLAGVISHELGHFTQATSRWLFRYIAAVTNWFEEATARTGGVQEVIRDQGDETEGSAKILVLMAWLVTGSGRLLLLLFALLSRMITFHLLRQMEFDADRYEAEVAGSAQFALTSERLCLLQMGWQNTLIAAMRGELDPNASGSLAELAVEEADTLCDRDRRRAARAMAPQRAQWFDSHPSPTERIAAVARNPQPGIFQLEGPAIGLLTIRALPYRPVR
jgi:Zn-dependent protease with chaperone function